LRAEGVGRQAGDAAKLAGEVALVGEAGEQADFGERQFVIEQVSAGSANAQATGVFADAFALEATEDAREMYRMHTSSSAQIIERQARATFGVQFVQDAGEPKRSLLLLLQRKPRRKARDFGEQAFNTQRIRLLDRKCLSEQLHRQPKQRAATTVLASPVELAGTFGEPRSPAGSQLDVEEAQTAGRNFILMRNARGPEHQRHWRKLFLLAAVAFPVKTMQQQAEKRQFVGVLGQLPRYRMAQIAENRAGMLLAMADGAEELATLKSGFAGGNRLRFSHGNSLRGKMLLLF
jgi:hypothetical protein